MDDTDSWVDCWVCSEPITENDVDINDTDNGLAHNKCLSEWRDDAPGRAADFYFDAAGDR